MNKYNYFIIILALLLVIAPVSAAFTSLGTFEQGTEIVLRQLCDNCTSNNITSIVYPNGTSIIENVEMTRNDTSYNYTLNSSLTIPLGDYFVNGVGNQDGRNDIWSYTFEVTPTGFTRTLGFYFIILLVTGGFIALGLWKQDIPITILGSFGLFLVGLYTLLNGIAGIRDQTTIYGLSIILIFAGSYISIRSGMELFN